MCGCCCCKEHDGNGNGNGGGGTPPVRCTRYQVTFQSIDVTSIDDGFLGGSLEVTFTFSVNGQVQTWQNAALDVGVTPIGLTFFADVPTDTSTIVVDVTGVEDDPFFDDQLPGFNQVFSQGQNWGEGAQAGGGTDSNITYTLNYTIACARRTSIAVSRAALVAYGQDRVSTRKGAESASEAVLLSWALDRLRRSDGWEVVSATGEEYTLAGYGVLPARLEKKYGQQRRGRQSTRRSR
jgi:hypothetical protein